MTGRVGKTFTSFVWSAQVELNGQLTEWVPNTALLIAPVIPSMGNCGPRRHQIWTQAFRWHHFTSRLNLRGFWRTQIWSTLVPCYFWLPDLGCGSPLNTINRAELVPVQIVPNDLIRFRLNSRDRGGGDGGENIERRGRRWGGGGLVEGERVTMDQWKEEERELCDGSGWWVQHSSRRQQLQIPQESNSKGWV